MNTRIERRTIDLAYIALFSALIAIGAWICIPTAVPFTMQTFVVFLAIGVLGTRRATFAIMLYLFLGVIGLPVFSGFRSGIGMLLGTTGGYIVGFILSSMVSGSLIQLLGKKTITMAIAMVCGLVVCYFFGTVWFLFVYGRTVEPIGVKVALGLCVYPFIIPDLIKIALAIIVSKRVTNQITL